MPLLLGLIGQTGSGKNTLAVRAVREGNLPVEVVSLDSMKVYRGLDIGTSKPTPAELAAVPHHLLDCAEPSEAFSAARYLQAVEQAEADIRARGRLPMLVGGTGLYLQLLLFGQFSGPSADADVRRRLDERAERDGLDALHARLAEVDHEAAGRIHRRDRKRIVRALEVFELTGKPISQLQTQFDQPRADRRFALAGLRCDREALYRRCNRRCKEMFAGGWIDEVRALLEAGRLGTHARDALGYKAIAEALERGGNVRDGTVAHADLVANVKRDTRRLARKQMTWFKRYPDPPLRWFDVAFEGEAAQLGEPEAAALVAALVAYFKTALDDDDGGSTSNDHAAGEAGAP